MVTEIIHPSVPGNIHYEGLKVCPICKKVYVTCSSDMAAHQRVCAGPNLKWRPSQYGKEEWWCPVDEDKDLSTAIQQQGTHLRLGMYEYSLSNNKKFLKRRLVNGIQ